MLSFLWIHFQAGFIKNVCPKLCVVKNTAVHQFVLLKIPAVKQEVADELSYDKNVHGNKITTM
jgi:hypothetical protein